MPIIGLEAFEAELSRFSEKEVPAEVKRVRDRHATAIYANAKSLTPRSGGRATYSGQTISRGPRRGRQRPRLGHVADAWAVRREGKRGGKGDAAAGRNIATAPPFAALEVANPHFVAWFLEHGTARGMRPAHMLERAIGIAEARAGGQ